MKSWADLTPVQRAIALSMTSYRQSRVGWFKGICREIARLCITLLLIASVFWWVWLYIVAKQMSH